MGPSSLAVRLKILHKRRHHLRRELRHFQTLPEDCVFGSVREEVQKLFQTAQLRFADMLRESRRLAELTAELYEILVHLLAEAITLPVLQERLLTLEAYLLG